LFAAIASQGCIIHGDSYEEATLGATWSFKSLADNRITACPAGFGTVALHSQPVTLDGLPIGQATIDLFDCADSAVAVPLEPDIYQVWVQVTTDSGGQQYAESLSAIVDLIDTDKTFNATILHDGGYFMFDWALRGRDTNRSLTCAEADPDSIEIISTLSGTTQGIVDKFNCGDGGGVTGGLLAGGYAISIDAERAGAAIGVAPAMNKTIRDRNQVTNLGAVTIPIDGM
jgi:hypothetical protein